MNLQPDITLIGVQILVFIAAVLVLNWGIFQPALRVIRARRAATTGAESEAEDFEQKITELTQKIEAGLAEARKDGQDLVLSLRQEAEAIAAKTVQEARTQMEADIEQAQAKIASQAATAETQIQAEAESLAKDLSSRLLGRALS